MSTVLEERSLPRAAASGWRPWIAVLAGLAALYVPTYLDLARGLWRDDAYAHGPIVVAVFLWLMWRERAVLLDASRAPARVAGWASLAFGLALYLLGRTQGLAVFEVASHLPVVLGVVLLLRGWSAARALAFPILFLFFLVPLPGFMLDVVTVPLKAFVSAAVETLLRVLAYPVEREGVVLWVGNHQLLVADACSGLNSLYSLLALGLLYTHVVGPRSLARSTLVAIAMVPIAIAANMLRVLMLVLVAVHLGDEAAQGWIHDLGGMVVFISAFLMLMGVDALIRKARGVRREAGEQTAPGKAPLLAPRASRIVPWLAAIAMVGTAAAAPMLKPVPSSEPKPDLEQMVPATFGDWRIDPEFAPLPPAPDVKANLDRLYGQVLARTYVNSQGERMMLTVAYGGDQTDALKAHRQEACYAAQGFDIRTLEHGRLQGSGRDIPVTRMLAVRGDRSEPVTYWFTMGDRVVLSRLERLRVQLANGFAGRVPDGLLVRVSNITPDAPRAFAAHESFIAAILAAVPARDASRLAGSPQT